MRRTKELDHLLNLPQSTKFPGSIGLARTQKLLGLLGNPQDKLRIIHIAGTSGKGSTARITADLLSAHGFQVGLFISPHIFNWRERIVINNHKISLAKFTHYYKIFHRAFNRLGQDEQAKFTFFEAITCIAYLVFANESIDYAVIETGVGGLLDATNAAHNSRKLCIITDIGLDHTAALGETISKIAAHKAGIIAKRNIVIHKPNDAQAKQVIATKVYEMQAKLVVPQAPQNISFNIKNQYQTFDAQLQTRKFASLALNLLGEFQTRNTLLALTALEQLALRDQFELNESAIRTALRHLHHPLRFQIMHKHKQTIIIDGAHNPQKIQSFLSSLQKYFGVQDYIFIFANKLTKDGPGMLRQIVPLASELILTSTKDIHTLNTQQSNLQSNLDFVTSIGYSKIRLLSDNIEALSYALQSKHSFIIVTGSFSHSSRIASYLTIG